MVVSPSAALVTKRDRRNRAILDYALSFGLPVIMMACHIVYQPNRYAVAKTMGCLMTLVITWPTYVLWMIWHPLLAFVGTLLSRACCTRHMVRMLISSLSLCPRSAHQTSS
jgi:pheromone a factor receptor